VVDAEHSRNLQGRLSCWGRKARITPRFDQSDIRRLRPRQRPAVAVRRKRWSIENNTKGTSVMNKSELIEAVAQNADLSKAAAARAVDAVVQAITAALKEGDQVTLVGFGTFSVRERAARSGRNPRTGDSIEIRASKVPSFKAGKALKDAVQ